MSYARNYYNEEKDHMDSNTLNDIKHHLPAEETRMGGWQDLNDVIAYLQTHLKYHENKRFEHEMCDSIEICGQGRVSDLIGREMNECMKLNGLIAVCRKAMSEATDGRAINAFLQATSSTRHG